MHFSIPDTQEFICERTGSNFTGYCIHINGCFHCCLRYKQIHCLHEQLKRTLPGYVLPQFPSKKFLPLTQNQLEQRRISLERYIQLIGQDSIFSKSELLRTFLLNAQQESSFVQSVEVTLDIYLMNGYQISINCYTTDCTSKVWEKTARTIDLLPEYINYFSLYLMRTEKDGNITLIRKLMDFEAPYITQKKLDGSQIVVRKSYWDPNYDNELIKNSIALNLLYILTLSDVDHGWILTNPEIREQLNSLQKDVNKKEYLEIARSLPSYGCIKFTNAIVDYPKPKTLTNILIGNKELRIQSQVDDRHQETKFKVTRMRCWRVTMNYNNDSNNLNAPTESVSNSNQNFRLMELSFEYLMAKNTLQWITIISEQAMLMSVCLQSIVDELLNQKDGNELNRFENTTQMQPVVLSYIRRDGKVCNPTRISHSSKSNSNESSTKSENRTHSQSDSMRQKVRERISTTVFFRNGKDSVQNEAFEEIGDDDL